MKAKLEGKELSEEAKREARKNESITNPNLASKLAQKQNANYSSSDSEVSILLKKQFAKSDLKGYITLLNLNRVKM